jgi:hypothetical protein
MTTPANPYLSKSQIVAGHICPRRLWLRKNRTDIKPDEPTGRALRAINEGNAVGALAQAEYAQGELVHEHGQRLGESAERTAERLAQAGDVTLFEAAFRAEQALVLVDVLERRGDALHLIEVKASKEVKDYHLLDAAAQAHVMTQAGYPPARVFLRHLSNDFIADASGTTDGLLVSEDVSGRIGKALRAMPQTLTDLRAMIAGADPCTPIGSQCNKPFACGNADFCRADAGIGEFHVEDYYPNLRASTREALRAAGITDIRKLPDSLVPNETVRRIRDCCRSGEPFLDPAVRAVMAGHGYPRYFLDFEGIDFAIPRWPGTRSYQQVPFQWSLHIQRSAGAPAEHVAHLHETGDAPMQATLEHLCAVIGDEGPVFVYNASYENTVLENGKHWCPALADALAGIQARIVDLLPLARAHYYHPAMKASWSIKSVLPTVSTLDYAQLEGVQEGSSAQEAFLELIAPETPDERRAALRAQLLAYCRQDTGALVQLAAFFEAE